MRQGRQIAAMLLGMGLSVPAAGCFTGGIYHAPMSEPLVGDLTAESTPNVARGQQPDAADPRFRPQLAPPVAVPPPPTSSGGGIAQVNARNTRVSVRAWVNGKPIFDEEVMQGIPPGAMREVAGLPEPRHSERMAEIVNKVLDDIIDQELAYQDAIHRLEAGNKKSLEKLKKFVNEKYEEQMARIRESRKFSEEQINEVQLILKRQMERNLISGEYMRSRILPIADQQASHRAVMEYYNTHREEFQRLDTVKWLDVFIAIGPKFPTIAQARRFADDLSVQVRNDDDFVKLGQHDDGDSKFRNGEGLGTHRGEIKPAELEETLFRMREGDIAVIPIASGVHIVRVSKRENAGQIPLDEKTQKLIQTKIKNQVFEHEVRRINRELRQRATIEIMRE